MTEQEVIAWAWNRFAIEAASDQYLLELAERGPKLCMKRPKADYPPRPIELTFAQEFSLKAKRTNLASDEALEELAKWGVNRAMGEDLSNPMVQLCYHWDHLICDCNDTEAAIEVARESLPKLIPTCDEIALEFVLALQSTPNTLPNGSQR
jgi:hypothetical protein